MKKYYIHLLLFFIFFLSSFGALCQAEDKIIPVTEISLIHNQPSTLNLTEAIRLALKNNHEIKAHHFALESSQEDIGAARSNFLPKLSFEERYLRTNNPLIHSWRN